MFVYATKWIEILIQANEYQVCNPLIKSEVLDKHKQGHKYLIDRG
jgi:hypothetical protein